MVYILMEGQFELITKRRTNMPYTVQWDDANQTAILCSLIGRWTWQEVKEALEEIFALLDTVDYDVHLIFYTRNQSYVPTGALSHVRQLVNLYHPNEGLKILVSA